MPPSPVQPLTLVDQSVILSSQGQQTRHQLAVLLGVYRSKVIEIRAHVPSYMADAMESVLSAVDRWQQDEQYLLSARGLEPIK